MHEGFSAFLIPPPAPAVFSLPPWHVASPAFAWFPCATANKPAWSIASQSSTVKYTQSIILDRIKTSDRKEGMEKGARTKP